MKDKKQNHMAMDDSEHDDTSLHQGNGTNGKTHVKLSDADQQKGSLKNFTISKKTIKKLKARDVEYLFPVQSESYTSIYEQNDCLIQASSGSGKTLAFVIPLVELLQSDKSIELVSGRAPRVLVLTSTRDSAKQISTDFQSIVNDLEVATIYTTKKKSDDQETAITNGCDILVGTPDRLQEFIDEEKVDLSQIKHVVLDEIDQSVDDLKKILKNVFTSDEETKAQLIVISEAAPDTLRKAIKKFFSADAATFNLATRKTEKAADNDDDDEDEDDNESEESFKVSSKKTSAAAAEDDSSRSLLSKQPNYTTYQLSTNDEIKGVGFVFTMLRKTFGDDFDAKGSVPQIAFTKDFKTAIFDLPSEHDEQLQSSWKDSPRIQMGPITSLPELDEASMNDHNIFTRGSQSGGGNRNSGRSNACFNCQKEGHRSFECPEPKKAGGRPSGGAGGGGGCFNCGKDGHKSFECPEPKKAGGGRGGGGAGGGGCFNCGKDGHKSFECPEPKKAGGGRAGGGGGGGCFNCGKDGHKSFECPEPKKAGGGGGGRGGGGAGGGGGGCFNCGKDGHKSFECPEPKKAGGGGRGGGGAGGAGGCFNCGKDGHKSFECPEPKKERSSFGGGGRGGGRGGARGGFGGPKRSFGGSYDNGSNGTESTNKKIKFDDDDE